tara:strand:- start:1779 stop:2453 length:675 start_codon:yes stop_codon:yes gene_type:complete
MIQLMNVSKSYYRADQEVKVLIDLSLEIEAKSFTALMGPSGSGKSTLLNLIAGIDFPDSGAVFVNRVEISALRESKLAEWRANNIGFIFQFYNLIPVLSALENVELPLQLVKGFPDNKEKKNLAVSALERVGLIDRANHKPSELSGGQQQRVAIARAIVTNAPLIVADEPTGDLDRESATDILDLMSSLNGDHGQTIVMVTHDPKAAKRARSIINLEKGKLGDE